MRAAIFAYSRRGCATARDIAAFLGAEETELFTVERLAEPGFQPIESPTRDFYGRIFGRADAMLFVGACGIAVRELAPHLRSKQTDPAVLVVDEAGSFVIPLLSGHIGGANALANALAAHLGATPVITTATDVNRRFSVDAWAARNGYVIGDMGLAKAVSAAILERDIPVCCQLPVASSYPGGLFPGETGELGVYVGVQKSAPFGRTLQIIPPLLHLGIGCRRGTKAEAIRAAVERALEERDLDSRAVKEVASIDLKGDEPGLLDFCRESGWPLRLYSAAELERVEGEFSASDFVRSVTGVDNVCERAALAGARRLLVRKTAHHGVTVAVAAEQAEVSFE